MTGNFMSSVFRQETPRACAHRQVVRGEPTAAAPRRGSGRHLTGRAILYLSCGDPTPYVGCAQHAVEIVVHRRMAVGEPVASTATSPAADAGVAPWPPSRWTRIHECIRPSGDSHRRPLWPIYAIRAHVRGEIGVLNQGFGQHYSTFQNQRWMVNCTIWEVKINLVIYDDLPIRERISLHGSPNPLRFIMPSAMNSFRAAIDS
jgi:hypothetical protein